MSSLAAERAEILDRAGVWINFRLQKETENVKQWAFREHHLVRQKLSSHRADLICSD